MGRARSLHLLLRWMVNVLALCPLTRGAAERPFRNFPHSTSFQEGRGA